MRSLPELMWLYAYDSVSTLLAVCSCSLSCSFLRSRYIPQTMKRRPHITDPGQQHSEQHLPFVVCFIARCGPHTTANLSACSLLKRQGRRDKTTQARPGQSALLINPRSLHAQRPAARKPKGKCTSKLVLNAHECLRRWPQSCIHIFPHSALHLPLHASLPLLRQSPLLSPGRLVGREVPCSASAPITAADRGRRCAVSRRRTGRVAVAQFLLQHLFRAVEGARRLYRCGLVVVARSATTHVCVVGCIGRPADGGGGQGAFERQLGLKILEGAVRP